jgi:ribonuclease HII
MRVKMNNNHGRYPSQRQPDFAFERSLWKQGIQKVAGLDEAGRGALAGPVAAGAVVFNANGLDESQLHGVRDSKQMTPRMRKMWSPRIKEISIAWGVGFTWPDEIDSVGILPATRLAMTRALEAMQQGVEHLLIDYLLLPEWETPQTALVKGDTRSLSIAAASILAKTSRDELLCGYDEHYPGYDFWRHKGYGTASHRQALGIIGACPIHRRSFAPIKHLINMEVSID